MAKRPASIDEFLVFRRITVRAGFDEVPPGVGAVEIVLAAAERWNQAARLEGLPDDLNPAMLDPARIEAFLGGLGEQPEQALALLEGRTLYLNAPGMHLDPASPYEPGAIGARYSLSIPQEPQGSLVLPELVTGISEDRVTELARRARGAVSAADREVVELEETVKAEGLAPEEKRRRIVALGAARSRRFAAAMTWREAARKYADADPAREDEAREARDVATRCVSPSWIGMQR